MALLGGLVIGSLWDERMTLTLQLLYIWGLLLVLMALDEVDQQLVFQGQAVFVLAGLLIAAYIALTGHAWKYGANLAAIGNRLGMPETVRQLKRTRAWLPVVWPQGCQIGAGHRRCPAVLQKLAHERVLQMALAPGDPAGRGRPQPVRTPGLAVLHPRFE